MFSIASNEICRLLQLRCISSLRSDASEWSVNRCLFCSSSDELSYCSLPLSAFCSFTLWSLAGPSPTICQASHCPGFPTCLLTSLRCPASQPLPGWGRCVTARVYGPAGRHRCLLFLTYAYYSCKEVTWLVRRSLQFLKTLKYIYCGIYMWNAA